MLSPKHCYVLLFVALASSATALSTSSKEATLVRSGSIARALKPNRPSSFATSIPANGENYSRVRRVVNVDDFGAKGDGRDDSEAFRKAWKEACASEGSELVVPGNRVYHLKPTTFSGPCFPGFTMKMFGKIMASIRTSDYDLDRRHWLVFKGLSGFSVEGGGTFNGNGRIWWENSCKINNQRPCLGAPTAVTFTDCENVRVNNITIRNAQQMHLSFLDCTGVMASRLLVVAPGWSPNTDGIHVTGTRDIQILSSVVKTGDDCVSIVSGSSRVVIRDMKCGPGHGISIGSLGKGNSEDHVSEVTVDRAVISQTTNGVRIKSWQGGSGYAKNIKFQNIVMRNVTNPIIIDQNYCDRQRECPQQHSAVQVQNVVYANIKGTSASEDAIKFDCSRSFPCQGIRLENINLESAGHGDSKASCSNIRVATAGKVSPSCHPGN